MTILKPECPCVLGIVRCVECLKADADVILILGSDAPLAHPDNYVDGGGCLNCSIAALSSTGAASGE